MSCKKDGCRKCDLPRNEMLLDLGLGVGEALTSLLEVARTGIDSFAWDTAELAQLAQMIVALVRPSQPITPPEIVAKNRALTLRFGPDNSYVLHIPAVSAQQRRILATQCAQAAADLAVSPVVSKSNSNQMLFQFPE